MAVETKRKTIGDCDYLVTQLANEEKSGHVQFLLMTGIAAALSSGAGLPLGSSLKLDLRAALAALGYDGFKSVKQAFAEQTRVVTKDAGGEHVFALATLQHHFTGKRALDVWPWLAFALEVNYGSLDFFTSLIGRLEGLAAGAEETTRASESPTESTGSSGDPS